MERTCRSSCNCNRCLGNYSNDRQSQERFINCNAGRARPATIYPPYHQTQRDAYHANSASYAKAENRVRFGPRYPPSTTPAPNFHADASFNRPVRETPPSSSISFHQQTCQLQQQLQRQTNLIREQQRQLDELRSRMVIPVLPNSDYTPAPVPTSIGADFRPQHHGRHLRRDEMSPVENDGVLDERDREPRRTSSFRDVRKSKYDDRTGPRRQSSLNRNNNARYQSDTESDSYTSDDNEEDDYNDNSPLIRNNNNIVHNNDPRSPFLPPETTRTSSRADVVLVQDRCCGTCCAIAAVVTCAVIVILIVYPIVYLLKHSSIHW